MPLIELRYGEGTVPLEVPASNLHGILLPQEAAGVPDEMAEIRRALANPIGSPRLRDMDLAGKRLAIMVSDITRPSPSSKLLPPLLQELEAAGVRDQQILIVFGMGIHRPHKPEERKRLLGEAVYRRFANLDSSQVTEYVSYGATTRGTPVEIIRPVAEADIRIVTGNIEFHYFVGYSGGAKAIMPGAASRRTIQHNHSLQFEPGARAGAYEGNPVRQDIEEIGQRVGIDFMLNVVLNERKQIVQAVAGDVRQAHQVGRRAVDRMYRVDIMEKADIVIASAGGFPKDVNIYQAQKALENASYATKDGGTIILVAQCREGMGEKTFEEWVFAAKSPEEIIARIRSNFVLGGHKAAAIARVVQRAQVILVSDLNEELVRRNFLHPQASPQAALAAALDRQGPEASILVLPAAGSTVPVTEQGRSR
ncbi:MAG: nickel-dependent lactate racemase [Firmicutes bacterium]|nr:nickel-dependent lactate racemase [Bacillota bacterium]